jgi:hypothetical protein
MAQKSGALSSHKAAVLALAGAGSIHEGRLIEGTTLIQLLASGTGGMIVSGEGTAAIVISPNGDIYAITAGDGQAAITIATSADLSASGWADAVALIEILAASPSYGIGWMEGTTQDLTTLNVSNIANAVWQKVLEGTLTAEQIQRILFAVAKGKTVIDDGPPVVVHFRDHADAKDRVVATMDGSERVGIAVDPS